MAYVRDPRAYGCQDAILSSKSPLLPTRGTYLKTQTFRSQDGIGFLTKGISNLRIDRPEDVQVIKILIGNAVISVIDKRFHDFSGVIPLFQSPWSGQMNIDDRGYIWPTLYYHMMQVDLFNKENILLKDATYTVDIVEIEPCPDQQFYPVLLNNYYSFDYSTTSNGKYELLMCHPTTAIKVIFDGEQQPQSVSLYLATATPQNNKTTYDQTPDKQTINNSDATRQYDPASIVELPLTYNGIWKKEFHLETWKDIPNASTMIFWLQVSGGTYYKLIVEQSFINELGRFSGMAGLRYSSEYDTN